MLHYQYTEHDVVFTLLYPGDELYLVGTFSNWQKQTAFKFEKNGNGFVLRKPKDELNKIGNSGYIEYCLWGDDEFQPLPFNNEYPIGYYFNNQCFDSQGNGGCNYLLLPENISQTELIQIAEDSQRSFKVKQSASEFTSEYTLANFRQVEGGNIAEGNLFRSYHPLVPSRSEHVALCDIERERQGVAMKLLERHGVRTVINLSETSQQLASYIRLAPACYYKTLWLEQQVVNVPVAYETVYFMSDRDESFNAEELGFQSGIQAVIRYIADNPGPYHVHCRLGSDRTGVIIGFLQLLMGADKAQIRQDYLQTNEMAIGEYRSFRLLEQALCRALGEDCFDNDVVVKRYLPSLGLSGAVIDRACRNLACNA